MISKWAKANSLCLKGYVSYSVGPKHAHNGGLEKADKKESDDRQSYDITFTVER